ncbi:MAG TPA: hypothetical protein IAA66_03145 [Candidatus Avichristensenella intestinipullorum]|uniref:Uncharacterized protein n=1 Tax=Candidatus Avichristensenella intestinipullorum TaxID=2840693 RepID=A0A9D0YUW8_9FIRM|nr:hypothetical protein [Candidatus Avichristensenella intestinipullorum]
MERILRAVTPVRNLLDARAYRRFARAQLEQGVVLRGRETAHLLGRAQIALVDACLVMQGRDEVRQVAAPFSLCPLEALRRQGSWMMLTAAVTLGCAGYAPLERFVREMGFQAERMARQFPQTGSLPYDDARRLDTTIHRDAGGLRAFSKGDPEAVLARCTQALNGRERPLEDAERAQALETARRMEAQGLRTLAFATRLCDGTSPEESSMTFLGVLGMGDLPHEATARQMDALRALGIRPVLLARAPLTEGTVRASGVLAGDAQLLQGNALAPLDGDALRDALRRAGAVVSLERRQRRRIAAALREQGIVVTVGGTPCADVSVAFSPEADADALLSGGLDAALRLLSDCRAFEGEA